MFQSTKHLYCMVYKLCVLSVSPLSLSTIFLLDFELFRQCGTFVFVFHFISYVYWNIIYISHKIPLSVSKSWLSKNMSFSMTRFLRGFSWEIHSIFDNKTHTNLNVVIFSIFHHLSTYMYLLSSHMGKRKEVSYPPSPCIVKDTSEHQFHKHLWSSSSLDIKCRKSEKCYFCIIFVNSLLE